MRFSPALEQYRNQAGTWSSPPSAPYGLFFIPFKSYVLKVIACDGLETAWEHVSVSHRDANRTPNWDEMCFIKSLFWGDDETVLQFHPRASEYVNIHTGCLHLWKPVGTEINLPPSILV